MKEFVKFVLAHCRVELFAIVGSLAALIFAMLGCNERQRLRAEVVRLEDNARAQASTIRRWQIADSLHAASVAAQSLTIGELQQQRKADADLIASLRLRLKDVKTITKVETVVRDTVVFVTRADSCLAYSDKWTNFVVCPRDTSITYSVRDSLSAVLSVEYQKRFLWFRWRPAYRLSIANHNPRARVVWAEALRVAEQ